MLNYEQSCKEWIRGCSNTVDGHAEDCEECTRIFREHIEKLMKVEGELKEVGIMTETVLFVGGSADGKRMSVNLAMQRVGVGLKEEAYRRQVFRSGSRDYSIYLVESESPDNLIPLLIEGYRRKE
jgi:hypothetical protein